MVIPTIFFLNKKQFGFIKNNCPRFTVIYELSWLMLQKKEEATGALSELNFHWRLAKIFNAGGGGPGASHLAIILVQASWLS